MIHQSVKSHTLEQHCYLEAKLGAKLFSPDLTPSIYYQVLKAFYSAYCALESSAGNVPMVADLLTERSKLLLLEQDMSYMKPHIKSDYKDFSMGSLSKTRSVARGLGMMYVMEGATLGGKQIVNHLARLKWMDIGGCLNFFNGYGPRRSGMWREFVNILENYAKNHPNDHDEILKGAYQAFSYIDKNISLV